MGRGGRRIDELTGNMLHLSPTIVISDFLQWRHSGHVRLRERDTINSENHFNSPLVSTDMQIGDLHRADHQPDEETSKSQREVVGPSRVCHCVHWVRCAGNANERRWLNGLRPWRGKEVRPAFLYDRLGQCLLRSILLSHSGSK